MRWGLRMPPELGDAEPGDPRAARHLDRPRAAERRPHPRRRWGWPSGPRPQLLDVVDDRGGRRLDRLFQRLARELTAAETEALRVVTDPPAEGAALDRAAAHGADPRRRTGPPRGDRRGRRARGGRVLVGLPADRLAGRPVRRRPRGPAARRGRRPRGRRGGPVLRRRVGRLAGPAGPDRPRVGDRRRGALARGRRPVRQLQPDVDLPAAGVPGRAPSASSTRPGSTPRSWSSRSSSRTLSPTAGTSCRSSTTTGRWAGASPWTTSAPAGRACRCWPPSAPRS